MQENRRIRALVQQHQAVLLYIADAAMQDNRISHWTVGHHMEHMVLVNNAILDHLVKGRPEDRTDQGINLIGRIVLWTGMLPRGRGTSPPRLLPVQVDAGRIRAGMEAWIERMRGLTSQTMVLESTTVRYHHPAFGGLHDR